MTRAKIIAFMSVMTVFLLGVLYAGFGSIKNTEASPEGIASQANILPLAQDIEVRGLVEPVDGFFERITKKTFGTFITPETSPVENDRFHGYHTGVDVEFTDIQNDVPVRAIADGTILVRTWANGYGGVMVVRHYINGALVYAVYGHLDKESYPPSNIVQVKAGDRLGILGDDHSQETDGVRKHLHFSVLKSETIDYRGYVQNQEDLSAWINPLDLYSNR